MKVTLLNQKLGVSSKRFTDLGKLNFPKVVIQYFMLKLIFKTAQAASKNTAWFKSGQNWPQNNNFACLSKSGMHNSDFMAGQINAAHTFAGQIG